MFVALAVGGLSAAMTMETRGAGIDVARSEAQVRALEIAETGLARAQMEIAGLTDHDGNGVGNAGGSSAGGVYAVTATQDGDDWTLVSTGRVAKGQRRIEQRVRRTPPSTAAAGLIAARSLTMTGGTTQTDSYDSRLGTYASQATHTDATGTYAGTDGDVGSNGNISVGGGRVRGDAQPGTAGTTSISGGGVVTGDTAPRAEPLSLPDPDYADFLLASTVNDNGGWTSSGSVSYDPLQKTLTASGGATVTFPAGTYFFSKVVVTGGSSVVFTGKTKLYVTHTFNTSGGSLVNETSVPSNLTVIAHPYVFLGLPSTTTLSATLSGGAASQLVYYGPSTTLSFSGGAGIYGSFVGKDITLSGGTYVHYDVALRGTGTKLAKVAQIYWRENSLPLQ